MRPSRAAAALLAVLVLAACQSGGGTPTPTPPSSPTATATASATPTPTATATPAACESFGSTSDVQSEAPLTMSTLTGAQMRLGQHDCYERFVFEMAGSGPVPGWSVGYRTPITGDASGEPIELQGEADLEIIVRVWTVTDFAGRPAEWPPFSGPDDIVTSGYLAIKEARNMYAFEGVTQIGLGLDQERPFRVFWLDDPARLVVDIATGEPLS